MAENLASVVFFIAKLSLCGCIQLDFMSCGVDPKPQVEVGPVKVSDYPWFGVLYYSLDDDVNERATTMAVLIRKNFAMVSAVDVSHIPRNRLKTHTRVVFGHGWDNPVDGVLVEKFWIHPEYRVRTLSTIALVEIQIPEDVAVLPVCPPISKLKPTTKNLYSIVIEDMKKMEKVVREMVPIDKPRCTAFYVKNKLWYPLMQPTRPLCAASVYESAACVWESGSLLITKDAWNRWRLVGFGMRGPGCGAPSLYVNVLKYLHWIEKTISSSEYITMYRMSPGRIMLRQGMEVSEESEPDWLTAEERIARNASAFKPYNAIGRCESRSEEFINIYKEKASIHCTALKSVKGIYRMEITQIVNVMCVIVQTTHVYSATSPVLWIEHLCDRDAEMCHIYKNSTSSIELAFIFSFHMTLTVEFKGSSIRGQADDEEAKLPEAKDPRRHWKMQQHEIYGGYAHSKPENVTEKP